MLGPSPHAPYTPRVPGSARARQVSAPGSRSVGSLWPGYPAPSVLAVHACGSYQTPQMHLNKGGLAATWAVDTIGLPRSPRNSHSQPAGCQPLPPSRCPAGCLSTPVWPRGVDISAEWGPVGRGQALPTRLLPALCLSRRIRGPGQGGYRLHSRHLAWIRHLGSVGPHRRPQHGDPVTLEGDPPWGFRPFRP